MHGNSSSLCRFGITTAWGIACFACGAFGQDKGPPASAEIRPFRIAVKDDMLADLKDRLERARLPDQIEGTDWEYGVPAAYMKELIAYWRDKYDWRKHERQLNQLDQFTTQLDGIELHFIHQRSKEKNATPLVITHGWPGSVYEFYKIIGPLTDPVAHGGKAEDAFHVVCPSLPGFGFSSKPLQRGWNSQRMAETIAKLMARLGYKRYVAQGGDWGSGVTRPSSVRIYYESQHASPRPPSMTPFESSGKPAPMGFALFPKEINVPPRAWVERQMGATMIHWTEMPRGGHFAALEAPELLVDDVRAFTRKLKEREKERP